jgi:hypothetical protein
MNYIKYKSEFWKYRRQKITKSVLYKGTHHGKKKPPLYIFTCMKNWIPEITDTYTSYLIAKHSKIEPFL